MESEKDIVEFKYDIRSFFNYFDCFHAKKIAERAGINYA